MHTVAKTFLFEAAHYLPGLAEDHPCSRTHGHSYQLTVALTADTLAGPGFVLDFRDMAPIKKWVDETLDHQLLNHQLPTVIPTSENLAEHVGRWVVPSLLELPTGVTVASVAVSETAKSSAVWTP